MELFINKLRENSDFNKGINLILESLKTEYGQIQEVLPPFVKKKTFHQLIQELEQVRGRSLFYPYIASGAGNGPLVELADGSVKWDFICGLGVYFFGHGNEKIWRASLEAAVNDVIFQGNLLPGKDIQPLAQILIELAEGRIAHCWPSLSGSMANDNALKAIRQKQYPAYKILAFENCFAGRTCTMAEITDNPDYRIQQPHHGETVYIPFYDPNDPDSTEKSLAVIKSYLKRYPGQFAAFMLEIVQGEGGFNVAPKEFYSTLIRFCKEKGLAIWVDEVQTFARTEEAFAYKTMGLADYVDVVTCGKILQGSALLMTSEYNPKPGLIAGTFTGATIGMHSGLRMLEILRDGGYFGAQGKIKQFADHVRSVLQEMQSRLGNTMIKDFTVFGSMVSVTLFDGTMPILKQFLFEAFEQGLIMFYCGHGPYKVRMLLPAPVLSNEQFSQAMEIFERALLKVAP